MMDKIFSLFRSRRFWVAIAGVGVLFADPFGLDPAQVSDTILVLSAWIVGDSLSKTGGPSGGPDN
jgi:hypothetical protein